MYNSIYEVVLKKGTRTALIEERRMYRGTSRKTAFTFLREFAKGFDEDLTKIPDDVAYWVDVVEIYWDEDKYPHKQIIDELIIKEAEV